MMLDRAVVRWGGMAAMIGAGLGFIFNLLHPRSEAAVTSTVGHLHMVANSDIWTFVHFMLAWSLAFALIGLITIGWSLTHPVSATVARYALASAIVGIGVGFVTIGVDGPAMKHVADQFLAAHSPEATGAATAVVEIGQVLFIGTIGSLFGLTPLLYGVALLQGDEHPAGLGWLAVASGVGGLLIASIMYLAGFSTLTANVLFPIVATAFIVWSFIMGWRLWNARDVVAPVRESAVTTEPLLR
jgi:hypothetical protein